MNSSTSPGADGDKKSQNGKKEKAKKGKENDKKKGKKDDKKGKDNNPSIPLIHLSFPHVHMSPNQSTHRPAHNSFAHTPPQTPFSSPQTLSDILFIHFPILSCDLPESYNFVTHVIVTSG